jgi:hypothetical protein
MRRQPSSRSAAMTEHAVLVFSKYRRFHVTHPDGLDVELNYTGRTDSAVNPYARDAWTQRNPEWNWTACQAWCREAEVTENRGWEALWYDSAGWQILEGKLAWRFGVPIEATVAYLNRYAAGGWSVVSVSEDRGVYFGTDAADESYVTRIRYLLIRTVRPTET